jgi:hypothetical protein
MFEYFLDDRLFVTYTCPYLWLIGSFLVVFLELVVNIKAPYGRYNTTNSGIPVRMAWFIQELPSFAIPCYLVYYHWTSLTLTKSIIIAWFSMHYFQRFVSYRC